MVRKKVVKVKYPSYEVRSEQKEKLKNEVLENYECSFGMAELALSLRGRRGRRLLEKRLFQMHKLFEYSFDVEGLGTYTSRVVWTDIAIDHDKELAVSLKIETFKEGEENTHKYSYETCFGWQIINVIPDILGALMSRSEAAAWEDYLKLPSNQKED